jgi:hypothetical protein
MFERAVGAGRQIGAVGRGTEVAGNLCVSTGPEPAVGLAEPPRVSRSPRCLFSSSAAFRSWLLCRSACQPTLRLSSTPRTSTYRGWLG